MERSREDSQADDAAGAARLIVVYDTAPALLAAFERELLHGAIFVPTPHVYAPGSRVRVVLELGFCSERIELESEVVAPRPAALAQLAPGVSLRLDGTPAELRRRLGKATGLELPEPDPTPPGLTPRAPRFEAIAPVEIEVDGQLLAGETVNLSYNGMLAVFSGADLASGTKLRLRILAANGGAALELTGRVANHMPCDHGVQAIGVQFLYDLERFEEVSHFVDALRSLHHARSLATLSGSLLEVPLETVLETVVGASSEGTIVLRRGDETGRIAYRDGAIVYVMAGLETGEQALSRLFCWTDAQFELKPEVALIEVSTPPLPLTSALLVAVVERDELARLDLGSLGPETVFGIDEQRLAVLDASLDPLSRELVSNAAMGFPVASLLDMVSGSDAHIYKAMTELVDAGVLRLEKS